MVARKRHVAGEMNGLEARYAATLNAMLSGGLIEGWRFEALIEEAMTPGWSKSEMPMLDGVIPFGKTIMVGGIWPSQTPGAFAAECVICQGKVSFVEKDKPAMASSPNFAVLCPTCFSHARRG